MAVAPCGRPTAAEGNAALSSATAAVLPYRHNAAVQSHRGRVTGNDPDVTQELKGATKGASESNPLSRLVGHRPLLTPRH